jgi:hypothetical protein
MPIVGRDPGEVDVAFSKMLDWADGNIKGDHVYYTWSKKIGDPQTPKADVLFEIAEALIDLSRGDSVIFSRDWRDAPECRFVYGLGREYGVSMRSLTQ